MNKSNFRQALSGALLALIAATATPALAQELKPAAPATEIDVDALSVAIIVGDEAQKRRAVGALVARGNLDVVPSLMLFLRFSPDQALLAGAIEKLTGEPIRNWNDAMLWQEAHPEVGPRELPELQA